MLCFILKCIEKRHHIIPLWPMSLEYKQAVTLALSRSPTHVRIYDIYLYVVLNFSPVVTQWLNTEKHSSYSKAKEMDRQRKTSYFFKAESSCQRTNCVIPFCGISEKPRKPFMRFNNYEHKSLSEMWFKCRRGYDWNERNGSTWKMSRNVKNYHLLKFTHTSEVYLSH